MSLPNNPKLYSLINIIPNPDGTMIRPPEFFPTVGPSITDPNSPVLSKDVSVNTEKNTWVRIFLPRLIKSDDFKSRKLPVLVYIHGGGFVVASPDYIKFHEFCSLAASRLGVIVVSIKYRLAPEHHLPAAYGNVSEALGWIKESEEEWIKEYGDLSNCILMGESAGGNIAYHVGLKVASQIENFSPLTIKGLVLIQPFFGGLDRSGSQIRLINDPIVSLELLDFLWELSLPLGADRNHEYCDVIRNGGSGLVDRVRDLGWWVMVVGCDGDPLFDRNVELAKLLEEKGVCVRTLFDEGGQHGMYVGGNSIKRLEFLDFVKEVWV